MPATLGDSSLSRDVPPDPARRWRRRSAAYRVVCAPPLTWMVWPVMWRAPSEARKYAVSQRVALAEQAGLVERASSRASRRAVAARLTAAGHAPIERTVRQLLDHEADLTGALGRGGAGRAHRVSREARTLAHPKALSLKASRDNLVSTNISHN
jgi:hypothetical protein